MDHHASAKTSPWIQHSAPKIDQAWAFAQALSTKQRQGAIPDPPIQVEDRKRKFKISMQAYFKSTKDTQAESIFKHTNTWEEVRAEAQKALDLRYQQNGKRNFLRRSIRAVADTASRLEFLTALIPSGDYMGVLCGGLKLVYNAANRMSSIRDLILGSLDSLSQPIEDTSPYLYTYSWSQDLLDRAHDLYVSILDAVEEITLWISKHKSTFQGAVQFAKAIAQQDDYGKKLEDQITSCIEDRANAFERAVKACLSIEIHDMGRNVVRLGQGQDEMIGDVKNIIKHLEASSSLERVEAILKDYCRQLQPLIDAINPAMKPQIARTCITAAQLLTTLHLVDVFLQADVVDHVVGTITSERRSVMMSAGQLPCESEDQVTGVLQDCRFHSWLHSMRSEVLVISNMDRDMLQENSGSPLSYLCLKLLKSLAATERIYPVVFFCKNHCDPQGKLCGASGMLRSLIAQLCLTLSESNVLDLSWLTEDDLSSLATEDLRVLCRMFEQIILRVSSGMIVCMIDGVDFFTQAAYSTWLTEVMKSLNNLVGFVGGRKPGLAFKILVTSHRGASPAAKWFPYRVELPMLKHELMDGMGIGGAEMQSIFWIGDRDIHGTSTI